MHYLQLHITKKSEGSSAEEQIESFLDTFHEQYWDWYQIGGRWKDRFGGETTVSLKKAMPELLRIMEKYRDEIAEDKDTIVELLTNTIDLTKLASHELYKIKNFGERLYGYCEEATIMNVDSGYSFDIPEEELDDYEVTIVDIHN